MNTLTTLEWSLQAAFAAAALVAAFVSARKGFASGSGAAGEPIWALVAIIVLAAVSIAVAGGSSGL